IDGVRVVDGGTTPVARRRGVLQAMIHREVVEWSPDGRAGIVVATATPAARGSHIKNGATALAPIRYHLGLPATVRTAQLTTVDGVLDGYVPSDDPRIGSDWTPTGLRWRTDPRSGNSYDAASLAESEEPNGLVYRVTSLGP